MRYTHYLTRLFLKPVMRYRWIRSLKKIFRLPTLNAYFLCCLNDKSPGSNINLNLIINIFYTRIIFGLRKKYSYYLFPLRFRLQILNNPLENGNTVREFFKISPLMVTLAAQKTETISVVFHPKVNLSVKDLPVFVINIIENLHSDNIIKSYLIFVSATVFMPR